MLDNKDLVLIIIDVQGKLARMMHKADDLFRNTAMLIQGARLLDVPIIWVEQLPEKLGPTVEEVSQHLQGIKPISKNVFSCWHNAEFQSRFWQFNPNRAILAGIETHICVYQTAMGLLEEGECDVEVVLDATSTRLPYNKEIGLKKIQNYGGEITSVETFLFEVQGRAKGENFKKLIDIIK